MAMNNKRYVVKYGLKGFSKTEEVIYASSMNAAYAAFNAKFSGAEFTWSPSIVEEADPQIAIQERINREAKEEQNRINKEIKEQQEKMQKMFQEEQNKIKVQNINLRLAKNAEYLNFKSSNVLQHKEEWEASKKKLEEEINDFIISYREKIDIYKVDTQPLEKKIKELNNAIKKHNNTGSIEKQNKVKLIDELTTKLDTLSNLEKKSSGGGWSFFFFNTFFLMLLIIHTLAEYAK